MTKQELDQILQACVAWVAQHHRTTLSPAEGAQIRKKLTDRLYNKFHPKPHTVDLVKMAHAKANEIVARRRDKQQVAEHARMVRA